MIKVLIFFGLLQTANANINPRSCEYEATDGHKNIFGKYDECGDLCVYWQSHCICGNEKFNVHNSRQHCCIQDNATCTAEKNGDVTCKNGYPLWFSQRCNNSDRRLQCHNSYQDNFRDGQIGIYSHYTCPHRCVPWQDMCQGINWCGSDFNECGPNLREAFIKKFKLFTPYSYSGI